MNNEKDLKEFWLEAKEKLNLFNKLDDADIVFGAQGGHQFQTLPVVSDREILQFERTNKLELPLDYRTFLQHYGAGGAGPFWGILDAREYVLPKSFTTPFPYSDTVYWDDMEDPNWEPDGLAVLCHEGCGVEQLLELNGPTPGQLWCSESDGLLLSYKSFFRFYQHWYEKVEFGLLHYQKLRDIVSDFEQTKGSGNLPIDEIISQMSCDHTESGEIRVRFKNTPVRMVANTKRELTQVDYYGIPTEFFEFPNNRSEMTDEKELKDFWLATKEKLKVFDKMDDAEIVWGAKSGRGGHRYKTLPVVSDQEILQFERNNKLELPPEYRTYLQYFGAGGAGPFSGILDARGYVLPKSFTKPFPYTESVYWENMEAPERDPEGLACLWNEVCSRLLIELNGPTPGQLWCFCIEGLLISYASILELYQVWQDKVEVGLRHYQKLKEIFSIYEQVNGFVVISIDEIISQMPCDHTESGEIEVRFENTPVIVTADSKRELKRIKTLGIC